MTACIRDLQRKVKNAGLLWCPGNEQRGDRETIGESSGGNTEHRGWGREHARSSRLQRLLVGLPDASIRE